jgi:hypothetical protein
MDITVLSLPNLARMMRGVPKTLAIDISENERLKMRLQTRLIP